MKLITRFALSLLMLLTIISCDNGSENEISKVEKRTQVEMVTNFGTINLVLYNETPRHRDNFINLAKNKAYDSLLFHRVINTFMIQAGDPDSRTAKTEDTLGDGDAPYLVPAEFNDSLFHKKGVLAAARDNNPERASSAMQFYIVQGKVFNDSLLLKAQERINKGMAERHVKNQGTHPVLIDAMDTAMNSGDYSKYLTLRDSLWGLVKDEKTFDKYEIPPYQREVYKTIGGTPHLDQNYTVFGEVITGLEIVDAIAKVETDPMDRPKNEVRIVSVRIVE